MAARKQGPQSLTLAWAGFAPEPAHAAPSKVSAKKDAKTPAAPQGPNLPPVGSAPCGECAFCGLEAEGRYGIQEAPGVKAPRVPLCNACGRGGRPTLVEIWDRIAKRKEAESITGDGE